MDPESDLLEAFATFDDGNRGVIRPAELRKCLKTEGNCMTDDEVGQGCVKMMLIPSGRLILTSTNHTMDQIDRLLSPPFVTANGDFKYRLFCETLRVTDQEVH